LGAALAGVIGCRGAVVASRAPVEDAGPDVAPPAGDAGCPSAADAIALPAPGGSFGVARGGRRTLVDTSRLPDPSDAAGAADAGIPTECARKLSVEVWYPTDACPSAPAAPYLDDDELALVATGAEKAAIAGVVTHAVHGAAFASDGKKHPLLLLSPGYGVLPRSYTALVVELVSRGYVVAAISHTRWTPVTIFADGTKMTATHTAPDMANLEGELDVWLGDARFVLDQLVQADGADPLGEVTGRLDLERVGMLGHSFGGTTALNLVDVDPRAKAALDLDGAPAADVSVSAPRMFFLSDRPVDPATTGAFEAARGPAYIASLAGAKHPSFTDFGVLGARLDDPDPADFGALDPVRALTVIEAYAAAFFDQHLAGERRPLLDAPSPDFPEIRSFEKKP
jgi:predicted dienelactone hydrolase